MSGFSKTLCFALFLCTLNFSSSNTVDLKKLDVLSGGNDAVNDGVHAGQAKDYYYEDEFDLSVGAIIGIGIAALVLFCGIPTLLCFCCAWCCFRSRGNKSTVVVASPMTQQYPNQHYPTQQYNVAAVSVNQQNDNATNHTNGPPPAYYSLNQNFADQPNVTGTNHYANGSQAYGQNQNGYRENIGFSVYPGSGDNLHATQSTNQYYTGAVGAPPPNPRFTAKKQADNYEQRPPYLDVSSQYPGQYHIPRSNEASKSTNTRKTNNF